ncbi:MAG: ABC transporter permease [Halieaceae bacterium]
MNAAKYQNLHKSLIAGWTLGARSVNIQVKEHMLGYAWNFIIPVIYAICYVYVRQAVLGNRSIVEPADWWDIIRVFSGLTLFQAWYQCLQDMSAFISKNRGMLRGMNVGVSPFIIAVALEASLSFVIRFITIITAILVLGVDLSLSSSEWMWVIGCLFALILSSIAMGMLLSPWAVLFADVRKALQSLSLPLVLITPIFYPAVVDPAYSIYWIEIANPLASPLIVLQHTLSGEGPVFANVMVSWVLLSIFIIWMSAIHIQKQVPILLERMGN